MKGVQSNWEEGDMANLTSIQSEFMSLEVNCEHSIYSTEYKPLYKPCYTEIEDHVAFK